MGSSVKRPSPAVSRKPLNRRLLALGITVVILASVSAGAGLIIHEEGQAYRFTTVHGETVEMYGRGLYQHDTFFKAPILRGTDLLTLFVAVPLLILALLWSGRGHARGQVFLLGMLSYFLYTAISISFGVKANALLPIYLPYFSATLFAFILSFASVNQLSEPEKIFARIPRKLMAAFLVFSGLSLFVWLIPIIESIAQHTVPHGVDSYTTEVTYFIDLGIIAPAAFIAAWLMLRRNPAAIPLGVAILTLNALIGPMVASQSFMQARAGIQLSVVEQIAFVGVFLATSLVAALLVIMQLRAIPKDR